MVGLKMFDQWLAKKCCNLCPVPRYPKKDAVWNLFEKLGFKHQKKFPGYKFLRRGGLSSPHVQYVTDADLIFNNPQGGLVRVEDFDVLCTLALQLFDKHVYAARIVRDQEELVDEEIADVGELRSVVQEGCDVATLVGMFRLRNGWCVPVDLTLQCGESDMTKDERINRIISNLEKHDFAKVISRIRSILPKQHKAGFAAAWNHSGGALRFLVKQLHLSKKMSTVQQEVYLRLSADLKDSKHFSKKGCFKMPKNNKQQQTSSSHHHE